jgi:hypothetical protein
VVLDGDRGDRVVLELQRAHAVRREVAGGVGAAAEGDEQRGGGDEQCGGGLLHGASFRDDRNPAHRATGAFALLRFRGVRRLRYLR